MQDMKDAVLQIYDNRSNLANTLKDTRTIVGKLERLLGICLQLIFIFFYLAIFDVSLPDIAYPYPTPETSPGSSKACFASHSDRAWCCPAGGAAKHLPAAYLHFLAPPHL